MSTSKTGLVPTINIQSSSYCRMWCFGKGHYCDEFLKVNSYSDWFAAQRHLCFKIDKTRWIL